jgi:hypothetical protein
MRLLKFFPAALALLLAAPAYAQNWEEYTNRADHFTVNFPGEPKVETIAYKTVKGTSLPANVYSAKDARGGEYKITVVNYASAPDQMETAITEAANTERAKGDVKFDALEHQNNMKSQRISVAMPNGRFLLAEALADHGRLFIMEADTPPKVPPPSQFQASLQVLDDAGVAIRYKNPDSTERVR